MLVPHRGRMRGVGHRHLRCGWGTDKRHAVETGRGPRGPLQEAPLLAVMARGGPPASVVWAGGASRVSTCCRSFKSLKAHSCLLVCFHVDSPSSVLCDNETDEECHIFRSQVFSPSGRVAQGFHRPCFLRRVSSEAR